MRKWGGGLGLTPGDKAQDGFRVFWVGSGGFLGLVRGMGLCSVGLVGFSGFSQTGLVG